jgi:hypothetical protein
MSAKGKRSKRTGPGLTKAPRSAARLIGGSDQLLADLRGLIQTARRGVAAFIHSGLVSLYWQIGPRIRQDILQEKRAEYGQEIVSAVGRQLEQELREATRMARTRLEQREEGE